MNEYLLYGIIALIVIVILVFIFLKVMKNKQPKQVSAADIPVDVIVLSKLSAVRRILKKQQLLLQKSLSL